MVILIADDLPLQRKLLRNQLAEEQHVVFEAGDGVEALAVLERERVDAVISDVLMPGMDGFELCRRIRAHARLRFLPFLIYTSAYDSPGDEQTAQLVGADGFLLKPAPKFELLARLAAAVANSRRPQPAPAEPPSELVVMREYNAALVRKLEEKNAELAARMAELSEAGELNRQIVHCAEEGITVLDRELRYRIFNPCMEAITGWVAADVIGRTVLEVLPGPVGEETVGRLRRALAGEVVDSGDRRKPDGASGWLVSKASPLRNVQGEIVGVIVIVADITERKWAEHELDRERRLMRKIIDQIPDPIYVKDGESRFLLANEALARLLGVANQAELIGRSDPDFFPAADAAKFRADELRVLAGQPQLSQQEHVRAADGGDRVLLTTKLPLRDARGEIISIVGIGRDITDRQEAEEALRQSEERLQTVVENLSEGLVIATLDGELVHWNRAALDLHGFASVEEVRRMLPDFADIFELATLDGEVLPLEQWPLSRVMRGETVRYCELRVRKPGTAWERICSYGGARVRDGGGRDLAFVTIDDITERKLGEQRIREQARLLDLARDSISERDLDDRIRYWNEGSKRLYGWAQAAMLGRSVHETLQPDPEEFRRAKAQVLKTGEWTGEFRHAHREGRLVTVSSRWTLVRDADGEPRSILAIDTDVTDRKVLEEQFLRAQRVEAIGTLASGVAHDLNNILAPILMSAPILRWNLPPKETEKILATIETSAQRGADLVRQLLTFGRGIEGHRGVLRIDSLVREIARIAQETFPKNISTVFELARDLRQVRADPTQLHQVLLNLAVNARDAMPQGGTLTLAADNADIDESFASMLPGAKPGRYLLLRVADTGTGIPAEILNKIFDPFFTTKAPGKGTGLGLATVMGIVKSHGGFLNVRSAVGEGTVFFIYLPAIEEAVADTEPAATAGPPRGAGELLLVVDDEENIRNVVRETLARHGYEVVTATDGADAVAHYARLGDKIRAVITDIDMPVMDGVAMIQVLKRLNPNLRALVSSGLASSGRIEERRRELEPLGVREIIVKPYTADQILSAVHELLTR